MRASPRAAPLLAAAFAALCWAPAAHAAASDAIAQPFLWVTLILVCAKLGALVGRLRLPVVLGELLAGIVLGNLALLGLEFGARIEANAVVQFLAQLGAVILLFQLGLESSVASMRRVGARAFWVATLGVAVPFVLGTYLVGPWLMPDRPFAAYLFLGAALTATSVGITGRVLRDLGALRSREAQIVLGAAVIDDVLGLVILSVVASIAAKGSVAASDVAWIVVQAAVFLAAALVLGQRLAPHLSRLFARIHTGEGMKLTFALALCLVFAYLAHLIGLAPIVGAFAAGLVLEEVHFTPFDAPRIRQEVLDAVSQNDAQTRKRVAKVLDAHAQRHLEHLVEPVGHLLVPIFFVFAGMHVKLEALLDPRVALIAAGITLTAVLGKLAAGLAAGNADRWLVGWGMVPRGEVGLIFAFVGKSVGVVDDAMFSVIVVVVMATTLVTPPILAWLLQKRAAPLAEAGERAPVTPR
jgi:Kef-type K+ transport system membrane component KefB